MRRASTVALLALLATGPAMAVTCAQDTVPSATLLVPHFLVSRNGVDGGTPIPPIGVNTVLAITNTAPIGVITHVTLFNKYGAPVMGFNVPLRGHDVVFFDMRQVLNGDLNLNSVRMGEACARGVGYGPEVYQRFENPDPEDRALASGSYNALPATLLAELRDSLDESGDVTSFLTAKSANLLDVDNPACGTGGDGRLAGDFSGYLTIDVVNYCTVHGPAYPDSLYFVNDALATNGWSWSVAGETGETPNVLLGDVFEVDPAGGSISGDPMVAVELDARLAEPTCNWQAVAYQRSDACRTFYSRYAAAGNGWRDGGSTPDSVPEPYRGIGDGREPLAARYGFRYLSDPQKGLKSWAIVWRTDLWTAPSATPYGVPSLCRWWADCVGSTDITRCRRWGSWSRDRAPTIRIFNNDAAEFLFSQLGCPATSCVLPEPYVYLESQRIALTGNADLGLNDPNFKGGWIEIGFGDRTDPTAQAWVGIQHSAPGQLISVGHDATVLSKPIDCVPALFAAPAPPGAPRIESAP